MNSSIGRRFSAIMRMAVGQQCGLRCAPWLLSSLVSQSIANAMLNPSYDVDVLLVNVNVNLRAASALSSQIGRKQWRGTLIDFR